MAKVISIQQRASTPVNADLKTAQGSIWRAECILETAYRALDSADETAQSDTITQAISTVRIGLDQLRTAEEELERFSMRLFHEGSPPVDVKELQRLAGKR